MPLDIHTVNAMSCCEVGDARQSTVDHFDMLFSPLCVFVVEALKGHVMEYL